MRILTGYGDFRCWYLIYFYSFPNNRLERDGRIQTKYVFNFAFVVVLDKPQYLIKGNERSIEYPNIGAIGNQDQVFNPARYEHIFINIFHYEYDKVE